MTHKEASINNKRVRCTGPYITIIRGSIAGIILLNKRRKYEGP
jgi:hypothetical protein